MVLWDTGNSRSDYFGFRLAAQLKTVLYRMITYSQLSLKQTPSGPAPTVRLIESLVKVKLLKNEMNWTNTRCPSYGGVCLKEVSVKRELTV